jgi:hypothetical protein
VQWPVGWCACPAFLLSQLTRRRQQGGSAAGNKLLRTDGDLSSPVAQRARTAPGCALARWQDCCQLPHAKAKKARSEGKATSVAPLFCSGFFFFASHNLTFLTRSFLLISLHRRGEKTVSQFTRRWGELLACAAGVHVF